MRVTLQQVLGAARARAASLAAETAGYLLLAVADQVAGAPRRVTLSGIELGQEGKVFLSSAAPCSEATAEAELRQLFVRFLEVASSSAPALARIARPASVGLAGLVRELEAALIPVNRAAAQRALARLWRETARALDRGLVQPEAEAERAQAPRGAPSSTNAERTGRAALELVWSDASQLPPVVTTPAPAREPTRAQGTAPAENDALEIDVELELDSEELRPEREAETRPEPVLLRAPSLHPSAPLAAALSERPAYEAETRPEPVVLRASELKAAARLVHQANGEEPEPLFEEDIFEEGDPEIALYFGPVEPAVGDASEAGSASSVDSGLDSEYDLSPEPSVEIGVSLGPHPGVLAMLEDEALALSVEPVPESKLEPAPESETLALEVEAVPEVVPPSAPRLLSRREPLKSNVDALLQSFRNESEPSEPELSRELRRLAGVELTPVSSSASEG